MKRLSLLSLVLPLALAAGCSSSRSGPTAGPSSGGPASGGPAAGSCDAQGHTQPFLISWDATDRAMFESQVGRQIVFVKYDGCTLRHMDECNLGSGAYQDPQWAPSELQTVDIANENRLMSVLPLAASKLGARVSGGESFHMEYYVAGTRQADIQAVSRADLEVRPGCEDVTHFVEALDLGALALGSAKNLEIEAGHSAYGFEVGGSASRSQSLERKDGDLSACSVEDPASATACQAPIRVTLRALE